MTPAIVKAANAAQLDRMHGSHQTLLVLMGLVSLIGILWCVMLLRRSPDWRIGLLTVFLGVVPVYQTVALVTEIGIWTFSAAAQLRAFADLVINVLFLIAVFMLEFTMEKKMSAEFRLRVMEPALTIDRHQPPALPDRRHKPTTQQAQ